MQALSLRNAGMTAHLRIHVQHKRNDISECRIIATENSDTSRVDYTKTLVLLRNHHQKQGEMAALLYPCNTEQELPCTHYRR